MTNLSLDGQTEDDILIRTFTNPSLFIQSFRLTSGTRREVLIQKLSQSIRLVLTGHHAGERSFQTFELERSMSSQSWDESPSTDGRQTTNILIEQLSVQIKLVQMQSSGRRMINV